MKIFTSSQIRELDATTIKQQSISSVELMERASKALFDDFISRFIPDKAILIFAGTGNNGGDALVLARLLAEKGFDIYVYLLASNKYSDDNRINQDRLIAASVALHKINSTADFPSINEDTIVVDGLLGTGLSRVVTGLVSELIDHINAAKPFVYAIDIPTGLFAENNSDNNGTVIDADFVSTFQFPKLSFLLSGSAPYVKEWKVLNIGLDKVSIENMFSPYLFVSDTMAKSLFRVRNRFSHKGTFGHALLVAGKRGMMGASVLATKACLRSGVGLVSTHIPAGTGIILQNAVPEAILSVDRSELMFTGVPNLNAFSAIGVGPGLGLKPNTQYAFFELLKESNHAMVIDADGLNILANNKDWLSNLPDRVILTPHPKEFDRLTHAHFSGYTRLETQRQMAKEWGVVIVLKGAYTSIALPDGRCFFNSTGNHGMATGGSGDVLTGIVLGLLAQGYSVQEAALLGVWWHGKAADLFANEYLPQTLVAGDIIDYMKCVMQ